MKKTLLHILLFSCAFLAAVSCGKPSAGTGRTVVLRLEMPDGLSWDEGYGDCFHIFENGVAPERVMADFSDEDVLLTLSYPASSATSFKYTGFVNGRSSKNPAVGTEQVFSGEDYDRRSDIMTIDPLVMYPGETESFLDLTRVTAVNRVYVEGLEPGEVITSVTITSTADISAIYNVSDKCFNSGARTLVLVGMSASVDDGSSAFSFVSVPVSTAKLSFSITTAGRTLSLDRSVALKSGENVILLSADGGDRPGPDVGNAGWLELPALTSSPDTFVGTFFDSSVSATSGMGKDRNYSYCYDKENYACLWVAYPLYSSTLGGGRSGSWDYNPAIGYGYQVNLYSSYNVLYGDTDYVDNADATGKEYYARGHQIPDADRSGNDVMQAQTYFFTNSTPQIQNAFNAGIWMYLEDGVRDEIPTRDTLYVVTGAAFRVKGGNEAITYIHPKKDPQKDVPVPNYYWKVLLKVKRSGSTVTSASTIGFWLPHQKISGRDYSRYSCSVDSIEEKTGFDFFANLPEALSSSAESNTSWSSFKSFR